MFVRYKRESFQNWSIVFHVPLQHRLFCSLFVVVVVLLLPAYSGRSNSLMPSANPFGRAFSRWEKSTNGLPPSAKCLPTPAAAAAAR